MATTMLPFLYQTRTIQRLSRPSLRYRVGLAPLPSRRRPFANCSVAWRRRNLDEDPIPFELPPDLAADPRFNPSPPSLARQDADAAAPKTGTITPSERRAFDSIFKEIESRSRAAAASSTAAPDKSMFRTPDAARDRSVIDAILSDATGEPVSDPDTEPASLFGRMRELHNVGPKGTPAGSPMSPSDRYEALLRFPASLRNAAKKALGIPDPLPPQQPGGLADNQQLHDDDDVVVKAPEDASPTDHVLPWGTYAPAPRDRLEEHISLERARYDERARVESLMQDAKTDFELWDVLEREVFAPVARLSLASSSSASASARDPDEGRSRKGRKSGRKKSKTDDEDKGEGIHAVEPVAPDAARRPPPDMNLHGQLYPLQLLYALNLLDSRFPGSRLALAILPRVKSLGLVSFVLGATSEFYTTLMNLVWRRYNDGHAALDLLEEMLHAGLETSYKSHGKLLQDILDSVQTGGSGAAGELVLHIMAHPDFTSLATVRIPHLKKVLWIEDQKRQRIAQRRTLDRGV